MKHYSQKLFFGLIIFPLNIVFSQAWQKGGNTTSPNPPSIGTLGIEPLNFLTNAT